MLGKGIKFVKLCRFNICLARTPWLQFLFLRFVFNRLFVTLEFIMQKSEYMGNLSFTSSSIFIRLSNKLLRRGKKILLYSIWLTSTF